MKTNENFIKFNRFYVLNNCITRNEAHPKNRFASSRKWRKVETTCYKQKHFCYSCLQRITSFTSTFQLNWCICCACLIFSFRVYFTYATKSISTSKTTWKCWCKKIKRQFLWHVCGGFAFWQPKQQFSQVLAKSTFLLLVFTYHFFHRVLRRILGIFQFLEHIIFSTYPDEAVYTILFLCTYCFRSHQKKLFRDLRKTP